MATKRPFHCRQGINEEIALETPGVGWDSGKSLNEEIVSNVKFGVSKEGFNA